ncbi:zf-HC2 domain-containing protein [Streptomyces sp. NBC_01799]|uniref:anti-sigma factor family protein n=1 Tax=Streptomyces sp. NBC_01800 TaxID=2975945 RepID=UPI002DD896D7|nr:zf-HC2 domain-containing protein [Streptomyces sp. NBC_01800]WSA68490.1 zf-HC2 domain-containing protein [Streptomyces sp. NBC_01800]WSA77102.1 zf-HC2 domain-containing protein [Streptomyces sp. NBC_01799]
MSDHEWEPFGPRPTGPSSPTGPTVPRGRPGIPNSFGGPSSFGGFDAAHGPGSGGATEGPEHDAAGAYVLGILDATEASAFEEHLAGCALCAAHLDEFAGMEPMLAMLAEAPAASPGARPVPHIPEPPAPRVLDRLVDEVATRRARRRRRGMYLVAAAAALIIGGPVVAVVATGGGDSGSNQAADPHPTSPAEDAFFHHMTEKVQATDPVTKVDATVGTEKKAWGTHAVLELNNVTGPEKCSLIAVSKTGEEEVVTSWSVPKWGYGIKDSPHPAARYPLYVHGGAAMDRADIDHFEVRTFDGKRLVDIDA